MNSFSKVAKKHLGQNFLINENIKQRIIDTINPSSHDVILEIGPGRGALTEKLIGNEAKVFAIEKDASLIPPLSKTILSKDFSLIEGDFLKYDLTSLPKITKVVGNIPYNISTPILEKLIDHRNQFQTIFLTAQREFAKRLTANPGTKDYGSLSCYAQYYADIKILFKISAHCFRPIPKVTSCFLALKFKKNKLKVSNEDLLFRIIRTAFQQRRKKIANALTGLIDRDALENLLDNSALKKGVRADHLSLKDYAFITDLVIQNDLLTSSPIRKTNA